MVLFAVMLPLILLLGVIAVDVGNWFVHQKHLQNQVDSAALAGGLEFNGCFQDDPGTNGRIALAALKYAGDKNRDGSTYNVQEQEASPGDVHAVLNSASYWATGDPTDGSTLDYTWVNPANKPAGYPCATKALDVKATDDKVPLLFGFIPVAASPHTHARVEIRKAPTVVGMLPFAIPEASPAKVGVLFVNEDVAATDPNSVVGSCWLTAASPNPFPQWSTYTGTVTGKGSIAPGCDTSGVNLNNNENYNTIVVSSRDAAATLSGTLASICSQNPTQVNCYGKPAGPTTGLSFIHSYSGANGSITAPVVHQVQLTGGCAGDASAPYFNLNADSGGGSCSLGVDAVISVGGGDPTKDPKCMTVSVNGSPMTWQANGIGGPDGTWTGGTVTIAAGSGRNVVNLSWTTQTKNPNCNGQPKNTGTFPRVAAPYAANPTDSPSSGPVQYLTITNAADSNRANSINKTSSANINVTVALTPPLLAANKLDAPIALRYASVSGSQNQAVDCDKGVTFRDEILNGCTNPYSENARNGSCAGYGSGNLPQTPIAPLPGDDCVSTETGDKTGQIRQAMSDRFGGNPCKTLNHWPNTASDPMPNFATDPRVVTLFITDENSFGSSGNQIYPIRRFAAFYITSADGLNCPGDVPANPGPKNVWGHWIAYVDPLATLPGPDLCDFSIAEICVPVLVE